MRAGPADLVVLDVFAGARTPAHLTSVEMLGEVQRVLAPDGLVVANVADGPGLAFARGQLATYLSVFRHVVAIAEPAVWRGRRFGNLVLAASDRPLPVAAADPAVRGRRRAGPGGGRPELARAVGERRWSPTRRR